VNTDHIAEGLRHLAVPLDTLALDSRNARTHDDRNIGSITASLRRFGQRMPIVVQQQGMVVRAGNGRVQAAQAMGWDCVAAVVVDEADAEAVAFALADNRTAELADWDFGVLAQHLEALQADPLDDFDLTDLWDQDELDGLAMAGFWDDLGNDDPDGDDGDGKRTERDLLAIRFSQDQVRDLERAAEAAGLDNPTDAATVVQLVLRGAGC
jgi:hypothetical protein